MTSLLDKPTTAASDDGVCRWHAAKLWQNYPLGHNVTFCSLRYGVSAHDLCSLSLPDTFFSERVFAGVCVQGGICRGYRGHVLVTGTPDPHTGIQFCVPWWDG